MSAPNANNPPNYPSSAYSYLLNPGQQQALQQPAQAPAQQGQPGQQAPGQANAAPAAPRMLQPQQQAQHPMQQPQPQHQMPHQMQPQPQHQMPYQMPYQMQPQPVGFPYPPAQIPAEVEAGGPPELRADRKRDREGGDMNDRAKRARIEQGDAGQAAAGAAAGAAAVGAEAVAVPVAPPQQMPDANDPDTLCRAAIRAGDLDAFTALWTSGTLQGNADDFLDAAVSAGQVAIADVLLQAGANPDGDTTDRGDPPIVQAALNNNLPMVQLLLQHGADINAWHVDGSDMGALAASVRHPDLALFKFLLAQGAHPGAVPWRRREDDADREEIEEASGSGMPYTPLLEAAGRGSIEAVRLLLDKGVDLAAQDQDFCDAFRRAAKSGHLDICQLLVEHGAEPDTESWGEGMEVVSSLTCAAEGGNLAIMQMVIDARRQAGAKLAEPKELIAAITNGVKGGHVNSVLTLCSQQFELNLVAQPFAMVKAKDWMVTAIRTGRVDMMAALHQVLQTQFAGWQLDGHVLCLEAMAAQNQQALNWLVHNFKLDINAPGSMHGPAGFQVTLLMQAASTGNIPMMQQLLQMGAKIVVDRASPQGMQRYSALEAAAQGGQTAALRFLQDYLVARGNV